MTTNRDATPKSKLWAAGIAVVIVIVISAMVSRAMTANIDTSGIKPAPKITTQDIDQQVKEIQDNPKIPEDQKAMIIGQIRSRLGPQNHP